VSPATPRTVVALAGSLRRESFNHHLLVSAGELAPAGLSLALGTLRGLPIYDGDVEAAGMPPVVLDLARTLAGADALLLACPEYNHGIPGGLKNGLDWLSRKGAGTPLREKPVAIMGASPGVVGTARSQAQLRQVLYAMGAFVLPPPEVLVGQADQKFDARGHLTDDATRAQVARALARFADFIERMAPRVPG